jgi:Calx-beta domain-containing protein/hemolysin type calcium-binding protein
MKRRNIIFAVAAVALTCTLAVTALAATTKTINGTAKADVLKGTPAADVINGLAGNDKMYGYAGNDTLNGGPGNDLIVGGPGADKIRCGAGKDTVRADAKDRVAADCEVVTGLPKGVVSVADASLAEGNTGPTTLSFPVTLAKGVPRPVTVTYATADGTATAGSDYVAANGNLTFNPGETTKTIAVTVNGDTTYEPDETLTVALSAPVNGVIAKASATGTITNDDSAPPKPGHYAGTMPSGQVSFDVSADSTSLSNIDFTFFAACQPPAILKNEITAAGPFSIAPDGSFDASGGGDGITVTFNGHWQGDGSSVTGNIQIHQSVDDGGTHYECDTGNQTWSASVQG